MASTITVLVVLAACAQAKVFDALRLAQDLKPPKVSQSEKGEFEGAEFWDKHQALFDAAWIEYGHKHATLYEYDDAFRQLYISSELRAGVQHARAPGHDESSLRALFEEAGPDVIGSNHVFTSLFCTHMREELEHKRASGIPIRRPNGMNR